MHLRDADRSSRSAAIAQHTLRNGGNLMSGSAAVRGPSSIGVSSRHGTAVGITTQCFARAPGVAGGRRGCSR